MREPSTIRQLLLTQRREVIDELAAATSSQDQLRRLRADGFDDDEHDPDGVPLSTEIVRIASGINASTQRLSDIDAALEDLEHGRHGICTVCGQIIPQERLAVRPATTRCVSCAG